MKKILLITICILPSIFSFGQPTKAFFVVHCDPNESYNFSNLEILVDSANTYDVKLTIEFTAPWVEKILPFTSALNKLIIWQSQGHEIGLHHHSVNAQGMWDGFSNLSMQEIHAAGRDTTNFIGNTDSLYNYVQQISNLPIRTIGLEDSIDMPSLSMYQTGGNTLEDGFSNPFTYAFNAYNFCKITHCFIANPMRELELEAEYFLMTGYDLIGANCHVHNFVDNHLPMINYFKFINEQALISMTATEILDIACSGLSINKIQNLNEIILFPNPVSNVLHISSIDHRLQISSLMIYNSLGQLITHISEENLDFVSIRTDLWNSGVYYIQLETIDGKLISKKIIKK